MDVAPFLGVNHVKPACYVLHEWDCVCLLLLVILHMDFVIVNECMHCLAHSNREG